MRAPSRTQKNIKALQEDKKILELAGVVLEEVVDVWEPCHDARGHHYKHAESGMVVDSVTTKLILDKPNLPAWSARIAAEYIIERAEHIGPENNKALIKQATLAHQGVRDEAGSVGSTTHNKLEEYLHQYRRYGDLLDVDEFLEDTIDPRAHAAIRSAEKFMRKYDVKPISVEIVVGSEKYKIAGTLDLFALLDDELWILDWKTSNAIHDSYAYQVATYKKLFEEMSGIKVKHCGLVHLSKDYDKFQLYKVNHPARLFNAVRGLYTIYDQMNEGIKLKKKTKPVLEKYGYNKVILE